MNDEELDTWLQAANAEMIAYLNQVVDTEGDLARLKRRAEALESGPDHPHDPGEP